MNPIPFERPSWKARALIAAAALFTSLTVMSGVLAIFMSASGESFSSLAGFEPAKPASGAVAERLRPRQSATQS